MAATPMPGPSAPASTTHEYWSAGKPDEATEGNQKPMKKPLRSIPVLKPMSCVLVFGLTPRTTFTALDAESMPEMKR